MMLWRLPYPGMSSSHVGDRTANGRDVEWMNIFNVHMTQMFRTVEDNICVEIC